MIVEVAGSPAEHVKESLENHVKVLKDSKEVNVNSISISEPKEVVDGKGVYTCFSEVDFEAETFARVSEVVFDFMPSSIEILEPSKVSLDTFQATNLLNNISGRMHKYDEVAMMAQAKINELKKESILLKKLLVHHGILEEKDGKLVQKRIIPPKENTPEVKKTEEENLKKTKKKTKK